MSLEAANRRFYIVDDRGLITKARDNLEQMEENFYDLSSFAARDNTMEGLSLLDTIKQVKPNILIGLSACGGLFNQVTAIKN